MKNTEDENKSLVNNDIMTEKDKNSKSKVNEENKMKQENTVNEKEETNKENKINDKEESQKTAEKNKKSKISKIIGGTLKTIGILIIIFAIIVMIRAMVYKKYDVFGYRFYMIMSGSMEPTIQVGDAVITKETENLQTGDIIAFSYGESTTVHRIVKTYTEEEMKLYQTKGDNNNVEDQGLRTEDTIKGKVIFKLPKVGNVILFIQKNIVIILILIVGIILIISLIRRLI